MVVDNHVSVYKVSELRRHELGCQLENEKQTLSHQIVEMTNVQTSLISKVINKL